MPLEEPLAIAYAQEVQRLKNLPVPPSEARAQIVRAKLLENVATNSDSAVQSLKLLGQDRELNLWQPELQTGVIVLQVPPQLAHVTETEKAHLLARPED